MKRIIVTIVLLLTFFVFQGSLFPLFSPGDVSPNLLLILTVSLGLMRGRRTGLLVGFFSGLLLDIFCCNVIGFFALLLMYLGYLSGSFNKIFYPEDVKLPMAIIAVCDLIYGFFCYVFLALLNGKLNIGFYFIKICIPECVYTTVITILIYPLIMIINRSLERAERKKERKFV